MPRRSQCRREIVASYFVRVNRLRLLTGNSTNTDHCLPPPMHTTRFCRRPMPGVRVFFKFFAAFTFFPPSSRVKRINSRHPLR